MILALYRLSWAYILVIVMFYQYTIYCKLFEVEKFCGCSNLLENIRGWPSFVVTTYYQKESISLEKFCSY